MEHADEYLAAVDSQKTNEWFAGLFHQYFQVFDLSVPDNLDPDEWEVFRIEDQPQSEHEVYNDILVELYDRKKKVCLIMNRRKPKPHYAS